MRREGGEEGRKEARGRLERGTLGREGGDSQHPVLFFPATFPFL